jgi:hypothetical protein
MRLLGESLNSKLCLGLTCPTSNQCHVLDHSIKANWSSNVATTGSTSLDDWLHPDDLETLMIWSALYAITLTTRPQDGVRERCQWTKLELRSVGPLGPEN